MSKHALSEFFLLSIELLKGKTKCEFSVTKAEIQDKLEPLTID